MTETIKKQPVTKVGSSASPRITQLKTAFLYVLIVGLGAAALTSVIALLLGQFS